MKALTRSTPITLMLRDDVSWGPALIEGPADAAAALPLEQRPRRLRGFPASRALFPAQLGSLLQPVPAQVDDVLGELAAAGLVTSDGYPALRTLLGGKSRKARHTPRCRRHLSTRPAAGRLLALYPLHPRSRPPSERDTGVGCCCGATRDVPRPAGPRVAAPPGGSWCGPTAGSRGAEIRGGRFVAGVAGEQYALPEVIPLLRTAAEEPGD